MRSPTTGIRYGKPWRPLPMPRGMRGAFCRMGAQWCLQYCRHKCRRLQYCLCQGGYEALLPQVYKVWSRYRGLTLCTAFSVRPKFLSSGRPRSDGPSRPWPRQSKKSGKQTSYGVLGRRRGVRVGSSVLTYPGRRDTGSESEVGLEAGLPIGEAVRRRLEPGASALVG